MAAIGVACLFAGSARADEPARPNVLWICADDLAAYACGAYGGTHARTPNIDRLAARGIRFDRAFCNSPVCTASRQSFLTGRYPRTIGVTQLKTALPESETTLAELLKPAGYDTAAIGKMHFNSRLAHGFDLRLDHPDFQRILRERGPRPLPAGVAVLPRWQPFRDPAAIWLNSAALPMGAVAADMSGTWYAEQAAAYLTNRDSPRAQKASSPRPQAFFLVVSFEEPHSPFHFPVEYAGRHRPEEFPVPAVGADDDAQIPAIFRDLTDREKQGISAAYHTSVEFLDRNVGIVLDALDRSGQADNTFVVFTGDHGYLLGHHGRFEKHTAFEEAIRAPLCIVPPGVNRPARSSDALVELIDIVPTILETCGVAIPETVQGRSLAGLISGKTSTHRDAVFVEYAENEEAAIRTDRWKFVYSTGRRERQDGYKTGRPLPGRTIRLYDLQADPHELTNLASRPEQAGRIAGFTRQLADHLRQTARQPELIPRTDDVHAMIDFCLAPRDVDPARPPNIVFILADDLGYGDLGCYGQKRIQTPNLDRMSAEGLRFTQFYAGSTVCAPSRCVLMTGRHTGHCTVRGNSAVPLRPEDVTVAERLKSAGYTTGLVGKWGLGEPETTGLPNRQGFDEFFGFLNQGHAHNYYPDHLWRNETRVPLENVVSQAANVSSVRRQYAPDLFTDEALAFLDRQKASPFFLYLAYTLPHANNERGRADGNGMEVPDDAPYSEEAWPAPQKNHAAMITRLDRDVGRVLQKLRDLKLDERTIVFFSSDNGPHREGGADPAFFQSAGPLRGHKRNLTDGGIRVPLLARWPGSIPAGQVCDEVGWFADFLPTALELAGVQSPASLDGLSLVPTLRNPRQKLPERALYWEFHERSFQQAIRLGPWKGIRTVPGGPIELYDVTRDIGELNNVAADHPEIVARIERLLRDSRTESADFPVATGVRNR